MQLNDQIYAKEMETMHNRHIRAECKKWKYIKARLFVPLQLAQAFAYCCVHS